MFIEYIAASYSTLVLLISLIMIMIANKKVKLPASQYFYLAILVIFVLTLTTYLTNWAADVVHYTHRENMNAYRQIRWTASIADNILRPVPIMLELMLLVPTQSQRRMSTIPAAVNAIIYLTAPLTNGLVFHYVKDGYTRGPLGFTVYHAQFIYLFLLVIYSLRYFKKGSVRYSLILFIILGIAFSAAGIEYFEILPGQANMITALSLLLYYYYLTMIHQQRITQDLSEKELQITKDQLFMLRSQIQPHFILNSLALIRSLAKRDKAKAVECIDCFSEYLKLHLRLIQSDDLIPFLDELKNVQVYITLAQMDYTRKMEIVYNLDVTDFRIPALSMEPIVENALRYGISKDGGTVTISTYEKGGNTVIQIADTGSDEINITETESTRLGIGLENTRKRLAIQCQGELTINISTTGTNVYMTIPRKEVQTNEHTDRR